MGKSPTRLGIAALAILILTIGSRHAFPAADAPSHGPHIVMIIRHAEKPAESGNPDLSQKGFQRADALAKIIPRHFPMPDFLIATKRSKGSNRPAETITPLSKAIHEPIETTFKDDDYAQVAHEVLTEPKFDGKIVLIAWHHGKIPELAKALGVTDAPAKWNSEVFDRVWEITYQDGKATWQDLPQHALPGDSDK